MASEVQICNIALTRIKVNPIQSLTQTGKEARDCSTFYPVARDSVLREHKWSFATKRLSLALLDETYVGWTYAYQYPTDCLSFREIWNDNVTSSMVTKVDFEVAVNSDLDRTVILTNKEDAVGIYTAAITDANLFDSVFIDALSFRLASDLAISLRANLKLQETMTRAYQQQISQAKSADVKELSKKPNDANSFVGARN